MGNRGQIKLSMRTGNVYFYTHWNGYKIREIIQSALQRGWDRIDDQEYFARILFCELVKDNVMGDTNYGIGTDIHSDIQNKIPELDMRKLRIRLLSEDGLDTNEPWISFDDWKAGKYPKEDK